MNNTKHVRYNSGVILVHENGKMLLCQYDIERGWELPRVTKNDSELMKAHEIENELGGELGIDISLLSAHSHISGWQSVVLPCVAGYIGGFADDLYYIYLGYTHVENIQISDSKSKILRKRIDVEDTADHLGEIMNHTFIDMIISHIDLIDLLKE